MNTAKIDQAIAEANGSYKNEEPIFNNTSKVRKEAETNTDKTAQKPEDKAVSAIEKSSEAINNEAAKKAELLAQIDQKTSNANLLAGIKEGKKAVKDFQAGYHLAVLDGIGQVKLQTALELSQQLDLLSEFTDEKTTENTQQTLANLLDSDDSALDELTAELEELLGKKQGDGLNLLAGI